MWYVAIVICRAWLTLWCIYCSQASGPVPYALNPEPRASKAEACIPTVADVSSWGPREALTRSPDNPRSLIPEGYRL